MKLYLDENLPYQALVEPLTKLYRRHTFRHPDQETLRGVEDMELFEYLAERDFDAIITQDANQLTNADERTGLRTAGLHWIGVPQLNEAGLHGIAAVAGMVISGLPFFLESEVEVPHIYRLKPAARKAKRGPEVEPV
ncbi:hypothetical protein [Arthrobacter sp. StoSoilB5]|uniref:PIN-like domain-containing protein n=1 Tax=Arthrobacter sp. StoSoilB5 TaxID=2830992 RepID=UPI001CC819FB